MANRQSGFTLIEMVVTAIIIAVLAAIAIPSYSGYVLRSNRSLAKSWLTRLAAKQEAFLLKTRQYSTNFTPFAGITVADGSPIFLNNHGDVSATQNGNGQSVYQLDLTTATGTYSFTATAVGNQTRDTACTSFTLNSLGQRSATGTDGAACWQ